jgi:hypothetical protein
MKLKRVLFLIVISVMLMTAIFGQTLSIQGVLRDNTGASVPDATKNLTFRLYTVATGGTKTWEETQAISVVNGVYSATLGAVNTLAGLNYSVSYWLGISVDGAEEMAPRTKLTLSPYAIAGGIQGTTNVFPQSGNVGIGTTNPGYKLHVAGQIYALNGLKVPSAGIVIENSSNGRAIMQTGWLSGFGDFTAINSGYDWDYSVEPISMMAASEGFYVTRAATVGSPYGETLFRIQKDGHVGVGTTNAKAQLTISNNVGDGFDEWSDYQMLLYTASNPQGSYGIGVRASTLAFNTGRDFDFDQAGVTVMTINNGNVGIGTSDPARAKLVVEGYVNYNNGSYGWLNKSGNTGSASGTVTTSIYAQYRIAADEFNAFSDARIKSVVGRSNSQNDLKMLNQLTVTDYKYVDVVAKGNQTHKKIIAQELEKIYPEAVSTISDFIPNVYQNATTVTFDNSRQELTIKTAKPHEFSKGDQIKLSVIAAKGDEEEIITPKVKEVIDVNTFVIEYGQNVKQCFVYGKLVNDFRVVDYEAITMLAVSAVQQQQTIIEKQQKVIEDLETRLAQLEASQEEFSVKN